METAPQPSTQAPRLSLVGRVLRPRHTTPAPAQIHLHFDRTLRVWQSHGEREPMGAAVSLPECA